MLEAMETHISNPFKLESTFSTHHFPVNHLIIWFWAKEPNPFRAFPHHPMKDVTLPLHAHLREDPSEGGSSTGASTFFLGGFAAKEFFHHLSLATLL
jgi:hypothetical protein